MIFQNFGFFELISGFPVRVIQSQLQVMWPVLVALTEFERI